MVSIAVNTSAGPVNYWNAWHEARGWLDVELDLRRSYIPTEVASLRKAKEDLKNFYMSMHSNTGALIHEIDLIEKAQQYLLLSEIIIAGALGVKELNFHLPKNINLEIHGNKLNTILQQAVSLARDNNVQLLLENNWRGSFSTVKDLLWALQKFPRIKMCFDIGHAHISHNGSETEFIEQMSPHILNAHIHDNSGQTDQHLALGSGNINYKEIINFLINKTKINRLIIENKTEKEITLTAEVLKQIIKK